MAARARKEGVRYLDRGDHAAARSTLGSAMELIKSAPPAGELCAEIAMLKDLGEGATDRLRKKATFQSYQRRRGQQGGPREERQSE